MNAEQKPEALQLAEKLRDAINLLECGFSDDIDSDDLKLAAMELESLHTRVQELETKETKPAAPLVWPEPDVLQYESREGDWQGFMNKGHEINTIDSGEWPIRGLYTKATVQTMLKAQRVKA